MLILKWIERLILKCRDIDVYVEGDFYGDIGSGNDEAI